MSARALITGGSAGLGRALCEALIADGVDVTSIDRDPPGDDIAVRHMVCDLAEREGVDRLCAALEAEAPFNVVIFNAGISATGPFEAIDREVHRQVVMINAEAPMVISAHLAAHEKLAAGARLAFVSSLSHFTGYPGAASYAASKDVLTAYANSIRKPFAKRLGVSVSTVFPGPLKTEHARRYAPEGSDESKRLDPDLAARLILAALAKRRRSIFPGMSARGAAAAGRVFPGIMTGVMHNALYEKLKGGN